MEQGRPELPADLAPRASESKRLAALLEGLRAALAEPAEQRLYRAGKLAGLFPSKVGAAGEAAQEALSLGYVQLTRIEAKGRSTIEWVRLTPAGLEFLHRHDSPQAVLGTLQDTLRLARTGVPVFLEQMRVDLELLGNRWGQQLTDVVRRLDALAERVDLALRRFEAAGPGLAGELAALVPWGEEALAYLDHRRGAGRPDPCGLAELFSAVCRTRPALSIREFHDGLRRLSDAGALSLAAMRPDEPASEAEYLLALGPGLFAGVSRAA